MKRVTAILILAGIIGAAYLIPQKGDATATASRCGDRTMAFVMSQTFVERELKAPASASFPNIRADGVTVEERGDCQFTVSAYVDAENSFGAKLRSPYSMDLRFSPSDQKWFAENVAIAR